MTDLELLTVEQVASELKLTSQTIRNWIKRGALSAVRVGHVYRVRRGDVDAMLERAAADRDSSADGRNVWVSTSTTLSRRPASSNRAEERPARGASRES
jgi:excisionase family DNA binding protein